MEKIYWFFLGDRFLFIYWNLGFFGAQIAPIAIYLLRRLVERLSRRSCSFLTHPILLFIASFVAFEYGSTLGMRLFLKATPVSFIAIEFSWSTHQFFLMIFSLLVHRGSYSLFLRYIKRREEKNKEQRAENF